MDIQGQHIECKDGGRREAGVQTRILLLVGWFLSAIDPPYRRNALQPTRNKRNGTFARILRRVGTSIYPLDEPISRLVAPGRSMTSFTSQGPHNTRMSILSSKYRIVDGDDIPSSAWWKTNTPLSSRRMFTIPKSCRRRRYPPCAAYNGRVEKAANRVWQVSSTIWCDH